MKNIHLIPTDKSSKIFLSGNSSELLFSKEPISFRTFERSPQHIYITSDEEIREGDKSLLFIEGFKPMILTHFEPVEEGYEGKKIILTTDGDLIKDGVQSIDDEFLEWFVKNPSCEEIKTYIVELCGNCGQQYCDNRDCRGYIDEPQYLISFSENTTQRIVTYCDGYEVSTEKIIISKEEPEQHIKFINNNIDEFDESLNLFKEKTKMSKNKKTKKILKIELLDNDDVIQIKLKPKYHKLENEDKSKVLERLIRWGRDELNCLYPEQD